MTALVKSDLHEAHALMSRVLRGADRDIAPEYPLVFEPGFPGKVVTISDGGAIVSACAAMERELVVGSERIRVGLIGSVATAETHRRRGLGTKMLAAAERYLSEAGALFSLLWADDPAFYETRGYRPMGWEVDFVVAPKQLGGLPDPAGIEVAREADAEATLALYLRHPQRVARTLAEHRRLMACPDMQTLVLRREGAVEAYACVGRGADFAGTMHEWAGAVDDVLGLLRRFLSESGERICLIAPPGAAGLRAALGARGLTPIDGVLGLGKLLDRRTATELVRSRVAEGSIGLVERPPLRSQVIARGSWGDQPLLDEDLLDLLFPARGAGYTEEVYAAATGVRFEHVAREPFLWGLDSI